EAIYDAPNVWHFRFNGEYPEKLVQGRERTYFEYFWNVFAADETHSIPEAERKAYTAAYARPGRMRAAWAYFASWPQLATEFAPLSKTKLTMPVLSIGGEKSLGNQLGAQMKLVADIVKVIVLPNTGHWILEEKPKETTDALLFSLIVSRPAEKCYRNESEVRATVHQKGGASYPKKLEANDWSWRFMRRCNV